MRQMKTMRLNLWKVALPLFTIGIAAAVDPAVTTAQTAPNVQTQTELSGSAISPQASLPAEAGRMYAAIKKVRPGELKWQKIPWLTDLSEAIRVAEAEKRPLLLFVSG